MHSNRPLIGITADVEGDYFRTKRHYASAIVVSGGSAVLLTPEGDAAEYAGLIDGLLIPGGADLEPSYFHEERHHTVSPVSKERSDFELVLLKEVLGLSKPVLGICYGMQLINVALGGSLYQDIGSQMETAIDHRSGTHAVSVGENRFMGSGMHLVNSTHHQAINGLGEGLSIIARSSDGIAEAFWREDYPFLVGVQWHPERQLEEGLSGELFLSFVEAARVS